MEEAIGLLSDTLPVAFFGCFFANFAKNRFFSIQNASQKGLQHPFW